MHMGHTLADAIVDGDEGSLSSEGLLYGNRQQSRIRHEMSEQGGRHVDEAVQMLTRNEQDMTGKNWTMIEECNRLSIVKNNAGGNATAGDLAEDTSWHEDKVVSGIPAVRMIDQAAFWPVSFAATQLRSCNG